LVIGDQEEGDRIMEIGSMARSKAGGFPAPGRSNLHHR
jgi:hypothetical protein